jgi:bla regulator protein blaR1
MHQVFLTILFGLSVVTSVLPQRDPSTSKPRFEAASIKISPPGRTVDNGGLSLRFTPGRLSATNSSLQELIAAAYRLPHWRIAGGPSWVDPDMMVTTDRFNVQATASDANSDQLRLMLQTLLEERFALRVHQAVKPNQTVYKLVVAKNGPRLREVKADTYREKISSGGGGRLSVEQIKMSDFVGWLSGQLETSVFDKTGLTGIYKFDLVFTPEAYRDPAKTPETSTVKGEAPIDQTGASLFTAIQEQLGLRLESTKGDVQILVIDHAEKPAEN